MYLKSLSFAVLYGLMAVTANAGILVDDNFNRPDGSLTGTAPTPGPGGVWTDHSGTTGDLLISGGQAVVQHGEPSEDTHTLFAGKGSGVLTATFDITVNDDTVIGGGDYEYFAHFMTEGSFNFRSRLDVVEPNGSGDYTLGISSGTSTAEATFATDFTFNTVYNVALDFNLDTGIGAVTVGGTTVSGTGIVLGEVLDSFALRQSDSSNNETVLVDNLVVSHVPEPGSIALMFVGLMGVAALRRR